MNLDDLRGAVAVAEAPIASGPPVVRSSCLMS